MNKESYGALYTILLKHDTNTCTHSRYYRLKIKNRNAFFFFYYKYVTTTLFYLLFNTTHTVFYHTSPPPSRSRLRQVARPAAARAVREAS